MNNSIRPIIIDTRKEYLYSNIKILENTLNILKSISTINTIRPILYTTLEFNHPDIDYYKINNIKSIGDYNKFCIKFGDIWPDNSNVLFCQNDGFALNASKWRDEFIEYDYIGSPWGIDRPYHKRVGNGGFSLRSSKLLKLVTEIIPPMEYPEDLLICDIYHNQLINKGIKFAPVEVAMHFSYDTDIVPQRNFGIDNTFGFHGWGNRDEVLNKYNIDIGKKHDI
jgi:Protein of unknown function (DUF5672)